MHKPGGSGFYSAAPEDLLKEKVKQVSPNLIEEGTNTYLVSQAGRERIAYQDTNREFVYDPSTRVVTNAEELQKHLELAAKIYLAYVTTYYENEKLPILSDSVVFDGEFLEREESISNRHQTSGTENLDSLEGIILSNKPDVTFEDIGGQEQAVAVCQRFAEQLRYPEVYALQGSDPPRGILLWGPPGTGKTLLAKAIANQADAHFLHIDAADVAGQGLYGQSEKAVKGIFALAEKLSNNDNKQSIIFVDEGDLLLPRSGGGMGRIHEVTGKAISIFAKKMDGLVSSKKITVIISTNDPENLDARILSRMEEREHVDMPTKEGLEKILRIHLAKFSRKAGRQIFSPDLDLDVLSERCFRQGLSGRDVADVVSILARQRGQKQLAIIQEAILRGRLSVTEGEDEKDYINSIAGRIANGDASGIEDLILHLANMEEIGQIVDHAKILLKDKRDRGMGFVKSRN